MIPKDPIEQLLMSKFVKSVIYLESGIIAEYLWCRERWSDRVCIEYIAKVILGLHLRR